MHAWRAFNGVLRQKRAVRTRVDLMRRLKIDSALFRNYLLRTSFRLFVMSSSAVSKFKNGIRSKRDPDESSSRNNVSEFSALEWALQFAMNEDVI